MAYVILKNKVETNKLTVELRDLVSNQIGPIAKPEKIIVVSGLPKTRSGKIMRRILEN